MPDLTLQKNSQLLKQTEEEWDEVVDNDKKFDKEFGKELMQQMDKQLAPKLGETDISGIDLDKHLKISEMTFQDKALKKLPEKIKKQRAALYWAFNTKCFEVLPYRSGTLRKLDNSFAALVAQAKGSLLGCTKNKVIQKEIERLPTGSRRTVTIKRNAASRFKDSGKCDHTGEYTIFG